ncbi:hypothetical protein HMPREF0185_03398 [Brevundimonas diminuta 470-4]|nr:hypothetical protein HMPREF0185_03398 [Brevundimonas diminuta 470-4]
MQGQASGALNGAASAGNSAVNGSASGSTSGSTQTGDRPRHSRAETNIDADSSASVDRNGASASIGANARGSVRRDD